MSMRAIVFSGLLFFAAHEALFAEHGPGNILEQSIEYTEITDNGQQISLSHDPGGTRVTRVPYYDEVDINSTINIGIPRVSPGFREELSQETAELKQALQMIGEIIKARIDAVNAYNATRKVPLDKLKGSPEYGKFVETAKRFGKLQEEFNELPIWVRIGEEKVDPYFADYTYNGLGVFLNEIIAEKQNELQRNVELSGKRTGKLRIEAFIETPQTYPAPVHLPGYDSLEVREIRAEGRDTNILDPKVRKQLEASLQETAELAAEAEKIRKGEKELKDVLMNSGSVQMRQLGAVLGNLDAVLKENWPGLLADTRKSLDAFTASVKVIGSDTANNEVSFWRQYSESLQARLANDQAVRQLVEIKSDLGSLPEAWKNVKPETVVPLLDRTRAVYDRVAKLQSDAALQGFLALQSEIDAFNASLSKRPEQVSLETWEKLKKSAQESGLTANAERIRRHVDTVKISFDELASIFKARDIKPVLANIQSPEGIDVPLMEAPDTRLEIQRTDRAVGDTFHVIATLTEGATVAARSEAIFVVRQFGRHSVIAPSVVLAKPYEAAAGVEKVFKFAPAVAWLNRYYPRQSEHGFFPHLERNLRLGYGIHAVFLDMNPQKDTEIGLGVAISCWNDILTAGWGWNLSDNERQYYYIGSNLIPLLHALGYNQGETGGKQP